MKQTAVDWLYDELTSTWFDKASGTDILKKAKEMEKEQTKDAIKNELKLIGNYFDISKLDVREQAHHIRFTSILKDRIEYYKETYK